LVLLSSSSSSSSSSRAAQTYVLCTITNKKKTWTLIREARDTVQVSKKIDLLVICVMSHPFARIRDRHPKKNNNNKKKKKAKQLRVI
jgi:hypothetical protein